MARSDTVFKNRPASIEKSRGGAISPSFEEAAGPRQRACAAGMDPSYWYPVEWEHALAPGKVREVTFSNTSVALYRSENGAIRAVENRCAHRQVKLSHGWVEGERLRCVYHGWCYGPGGELVEIPHERRGKRSPAVKLLSYPVEVRHGIIWVFFGDVSLMKERPLPEVPELDDGGASWMTVPADFTWRAHPIMIVNNVMDSTHVAALHSRRFRTRSFAYGPITRCEAEGDRIVVSHEIRTDPRSLLRYVGTIATPTQDAYFEYPHLIVSVGGVFKLYNFLLPIDARTTRIFMLAQMRRAKIPLTPWLTPRALDRLLVPLLGRVLVKPLFDEDGWSTEIEQEGFDRYFAHPPVELHPAPRLCYELMIRKWEEHLARQAGLYSPSP